MVEVRKATPADRQLVLAMGASFYANTHYPDAVAAYDPESVLGLIDVMTASGVLLIAEDDGAPVGMVGLAIAPFTFNASFPMAYEVMWWVSPGSRGQGAGKALLLAVEPACVAAGAKGIQMIHLANSPPEAAAMYHRMGLTPTETSLFKRIA